MLARLTRPYPRSRPPGRRPLVLGHRGASADAPENTLTAFREAQRQGADGVELDVMRCGSGELVVCHDEWLDRLAGEHLEVARTPLSTLRRLDVGARFEERFEGERIPTLAEVLAVLPRGTVCNVEIKGRAAWDRTLVWSVARELSRSEAGQEFVVSAFDLPAVFQARGLCFRHPTAMLVEPSQFLPPRVLAARALGLAALHVAHPLCTAASVGEWHRQGFAVAAWTVDDASDVERCCAAGVDALITNQPRATRAVVERLGL